MNQCHIVMNSSAGFCPIRFFALYSVLVDYWLCNIFIFIFAKENKTMFFWPFVVWEKNVLRMEMVMCIALFSLVFFCWWWWQQGDHSVYYMNCNTQIAGFPHFISNCYFSRLSGKINDILIWLFVCVTVYTLRLHTKQNH